MESQLDNQCNEYDDNVIRYVAGFCTRSVLKKTKCRQCKDFLSMPGIRTAWHVLKEFSNCTLIAVNDELASFFRFIEITLKPTLILKNILRPNFLPVCVLKIMTSYVDLNPSKFFALKQHENNTDHSYCILKSLCHLYVKTRLARFIKKKNEDMKDKFLRRKLTKYVHFKNQ